MSQDVPWISQNLLSQTPLFESSYRDQFHPLVDQYLNFYQLDFLNRGLCEHQLLGHMTVGEHKVVCQCYWPSMPKGTLILVHGYLDHIGLYRHFIQFALENDLILVAADLPGHGLSQGERGAIETFSNYLEVVDALVCWSRNEFALDWKIAGQSMGGAITSSYLLTTEEGNLPSQTFLLAPLVKPVGWPMIFWGRQLLGKHLTHVRRQFVHNSNDVAFTNFQRHRDPLQSKRIPMSWIRALVSWVDEFQSYEPRHLSPLIIQGDCDHTVHWQHNVKTLMRKFPHAQLHLIAGARHHLVNERLDYRHKIFAPIRSLLRSDN